MTECAAGAPRRLKTALTGSTIPLVVLGSAAFAAPAEAAPPVSAQLTLPRVATPATIQAAQSLIPAEATLRMRSAASVTTSRGASTYTVKGGDTLSHIALRTGVSVDTLRTVNGLDHSAIIRPGQILKLSGAERSTTRTADRPSTNTAATYTVRSGDTLSHIAARYKVTVRTLQAANGLGRSALIRPGQVLKLSASTPDGPATGSTSASTRTPSAPATYTVKRGDTLSHVAARHKISLNTLLSANNLSRTSVIHPGQTLKLSGSTATAASAGSASTAAPTGSTATTYTVKRGDTLSGIAARHQLSLSTLLSANNLSRTAVIHPGQTLKLSGAAASSGSSSSSSAGSSQEQLVPSTFLHYRYPDHVVTSANANKRKLLASPIPSRAQTEALIRDTARRMGVDPRLALGHAMAESTLNHASVSPANAIGTMQVIPSSGEWASQMVGRKLNLLDPQDNVTAGVAIIRHLQRTSPSMDVGIASYYQGAAGVRRHGMYPDTRQYVAKVKRYMQQF